MSAAHQMIAEAATRLAGEMPAANVEALACAVLSEPVTKAQVVQGIPHLHYRSLAAVFLDLWQTQAPAVPAEAVALALRTALHAERVRRESQAVEIAWTGPTAEAHPFRRTEQAILQVLDSAQERITLVSYAVYRLSLIHI